MSNTNQNQSEIDENS
ncbi:unnamed protein product, partial [Rotaria sordida]